MKKIAIKLEYNDLKEFIKVVSEFASPIYMSKGRYKVDAKSIMGVLSLDFSNGVEVEIDSYDNIEISKFINEMEAFK